jgi:hypothetical protein
MVLGLAACSLLVPFSEYDKDTNASDASDAGTDAPAPSDASDAADAGQECDADLSADRANCGACGRACLSAAGCTGGLCEAEPIVGASGLYATTVGVDDAGVYFGGAIATSGIQGVLGVLPNASSAARLIALTTVAPVHTAVTDTEIYWTQGPYSDAGPSDRGVGHVSKVPVDGGVFAPIYVSGQTQPYAIVADPSGVFWTSTVPGEVWTAALGAPANAHTVASDPYATGLASDGTSIFWSTALPVGRVVRAGKDGSNPEPIATNQRTPASVAVDQDYVYWTSYDPDGAIYRAPKGGGAPVEIAHGQDRPATIALDEAYVYWGNVGPDQGVFGSIVRAPKGGGRTLVLAVGQKPADLAVDDRYVYWPSGGVLFRVAK